MFILFRSSVDAASSQVDWTPLAELRGWGGHDVKGRNSDGMGNYKLHTNAAIETFSELSSVPHHSSSFFPYLPPLFLQTP